MINIKSSILLITILCSVYANAVLAGECDVYVVSLPGMKFNVKEISVPKTCKEITLNLKNTDTMPKATMGHNLVISKTEDMRSVIRDGITAGLEHNYVKPADTRVIGHTIMLGGGESTSAIISLANIKPTTSYSFFCSFSGHGSMKGEFNLI